MVTEMLSIREAAKRLGLTRPTVYEMIAQGQLRTVEAGRYKRIPGWQVNNIVLGYPIENGPQDCLCGRAATEATDN